MVRICRRYGCHLNLGRSSPAHRVPSALFLPKKKAEIIDISRWALAEERCATDFATGGLTRQAARAMVEQIAALMKAGQISAVAGFL